MAFVDVPRDLTKIKSKLVMGMTKRQLICFGAGAAMGLPIFFALRGITGNSAAVLIMMAAMLPAFFMAMYERDGLPAEQVAKNIIRTRFIYPPARPYKTENIYANQKKEEKTLVTQNNTARTAAIKKHKPAKGKQKGAENRRKAGRKEKEA